MAPMTRRAARARGTHTPPTRARAKASQNQPRIDDSIRQKKLNRRMPEGHKDRNSDEFSSPSSSSRGGRSPPVRSSGSTVLSSSPGSRGSRTLSPSKGPPLGVDVDDSQRASEMQVLREFDLNHGYGPCRGISRRERYERAVRYGTEPDPDPEVMAILRNHKNDDDFATAWDLW